MWGRGSLGKVSTCQVLAEMDMGKIENPLEGNQRCKGRKVQCPPSGHIFPGAIGKGSRHARCDGSSKVLNSSFRIGWQSDISHTSIDLCPTRLRIGSYKHIIAYLIEACEPSQEEPKETTVQHPPIRPVAHSGDAREVELDPRAESTSLECSCFQPEGSNPQTFLSKGFKWVFKENPFTKPPRCQARHGPVRHSEGQLPAGWGYSGHGPGQQRHRVAGGYPGDPAEPQGDGGFLAGLPGKGRGVRWALRVYFAPSFF